MVCFSELWPHERLSLLEELLEKGVVVPGWLGEDSGIVGAIIVVGGEEAMLLLLVVGVVWVVASGGEEVLLLLHVGVVRVVARGGEKVVLGLLVVVVSLGPAVVVSLLLILHVLHGVVGLQLLLPVVLIGPGSTVEVVALQSHLQRKFPSPGVLLRYAFIGV